MILVRFLICPNGGLQAINFETGEALGFFDSRIEALFWLSKQKNYKEI